ncbi:hypothetical protein [Mucilaginibacter aquaedulcis]|uniref:hypothetical protein n=1 Tax=Mucilaginibacter aquaedulcis TaxID=1187081 RepID=UPI0025B52136|nr:hypothetical protein [Mucilaginibacter aquaedulcis]MDN3548893.1 hypothetical protein [Mucilaginibacter aquaedulcis]
MKTYLLSLFLLGTALCASAQNKLSDLYTLEPGDHYPQNMPYVQQWITRTLQPIFVRNLQSSDNARSATKFLSFNLAGSSASALMLPNTGGLRLLSGPGQIKVQYSQELLNYKPFDITSFDYQYQSYFLLARDVLRITTDQMIANTMNFFIETDGTKKDKYDLFIDHVNKQMKVKMPYSTIKQVHALAAVVEKQFPKKTAEVIYSTYIQGKNDNETSQRLQQFYNITGFFQNAVAERLDDMMSPKLQFRQDAVQTLEIPLKILTIPGLKDSLANFRVETAKTVLNYHERHLEITFTGKLRQQVLIVSPKVMDRDVKTGKFIWVKPSHLVTEKVDFKELQLVVSENGTSLSGSTPEGYVYQLFELPRMP